MITSKAASCPHALGREGRKTAKKSPPPRVGDGRSLASREKEKDARTVAGTQIKLVMTFDVPLAKKENPSSRMRRRVGAMRKCQNYCSRLAAARNGERKTPAPENRGGLFSANSDRRTQIG